MLTSNEKYVYFSPLDITSVHSRLVENKRAAEFVVEIWKNIKQLYTFWNKYPKSKGPSLKSYNVIKVVVDDPFFITKLPIFENVSSLMEPFLTRYQTDQPMIPFIYFNLKNLMLKLLEIVVKPATFENCKRGHKLMDIDLSYNQNLIFFGKLKFLQRQALPILWMLIK